MSSTTEQIKDKLDVVDVVSSYIKLDRAGKNLKARCPFHNEKTPSFYVSPDRGTYYCFGCDRKGDIFSFVQEFEGLDFMGALKVLADRAGVEVVFDKEKGDDNKRLFAALEETTVFLESLLEKNQKAQKYLEERSLTKTSITNFRLGYIPDEWHVLEEHLSKKGFTQDELLKAGLVKKNEKGNVYDTFRGRIMFPIMDSSGRVVAFSGRAFETDSEAKYLNSPETPVFKKSKILYGFDKAKGVIRKHDFSILVEGNIDVMLSHQVGYTNAVAPLGTALTSRHLELLRRLSNNLVLALDADRAGIASAGKGAAMALGVGFDVKVAGLPKDVDPADLIASNGGEWKDVIKKSKHIVDFLLDTLERDTKDTRAFELAARKKVLPFVARIENKIDQAHFVKRVAERLSISEDVVYTELSKIPEDTAVSEPKQEGADVIEQVSIESERVEGIIRQILAVIAWQEDKGAPKAEELKKRLTEALEVDKFENIPTAESREALLFEAEHTFEGIGNIDNMIEELFTGLAEERIRKQMSTLLSDLKTAETKNDILKAQTILKEFHEESQKLESIRTNNGS